MVRFSNEYWLILGVMAATLAVTLWIRAPKIAGNDGVALAQFPKRLAAWSATDDSLDAATVRVLHADQTLLRYYTDAQGRRLELLIGYFRDQKFGAQVHSPLHCLPGAGWEIVRHETPPLPFHAENTPANQLHIEKNGESLLVLYWFASSGRVVKNEFDLKIRLLLNALQHQPTAVFFYRLSIPYSDANEEAAQRTLQEFLRIAHAHFQKIS